MTYKGGNCTLKHHRNTTALNRYTLKATCLTKKQNGLLTVQVCHNTKLPFTHRQCKFYPEEKFQLVSLFKSDAGKGDETTFTSIFTVYLVNVIVIFKEMSTIISTTN